MIILRFLIREKSKGHCDNIKVFNQGISNQGKIRDFDC